MNTQTQNQTEAEDQKSWDEEFERIQMEWATEREQESFEAAGRG